MNTVPGWALHRYKADKIWSLEKTVSETYSGAAKYCWGEADVSWAATGGLGSLQVPVLSGTVCGVEWQIYKDAATADATVTAKTMRGFTRAMQPRQRTMLVALHPLWLQNSSPANLGIWRELLLTMRTSAQPPLQFLNKVSAEVRK